MSDKTGATIGLAPEPGLRVAVAGGCGGIGRLVVTELLAHDCDVTIIDMQPSIDAHEPPAAAQVLAADLTSDVDVTHVAESLRKTPGTLDALVNLCGYTLGRRPLEDYSVEDWRAVVQGNLDAAFLICSRLLPLLREGNDATIVNVASSLAVKSAPGYGPYSAAKAGILALTRMLSEENAPKVRANAVAPNAVNTEFLTGGTGRHADSNQELLDLDAYGKTLPLERSAEPADVVGPVLFLLSPAARFMTGQTLHVNGGLWQP